MATYLRHPILIALLITLLPWLAGTTQAQSGSLSPVFILFTAHSPTVQSQVETIINSQGGRLRHTWPGRAVIAIVPDQTRATLAALPGPVELFTGPIDLAQMDPYGPQARLVAAIWNQRFEPSTQSLTPLQPESAKAHPDALLPPDLPAKDALNLSVESTITPGYYQTSEYLAGSIAVGLVLLESNGQGDPSSEDWSSDEKQQVFSEIVTALEWWAELEPRANLSFVYDDHLTQPLPTTMEPITRPYSDQRYWIAEAMASLGYDSPFYFSRVRDYTNDLRATYQTDWAFTIFVVDSSADADNRFSDGYFAYAYLGGPFMVMTSGNNGYGPAHMDAVAAHEMGHIFNALDQYYSAYQDCSRRTGYLNVENQNSQYGDCISNEASIMRGHVPPFHQNQLDPYAAGQIGWRDSDGDNILDPLDTTLPVSIDQLIQTGTAITVSGQTEIVPYPSPSQPSITINQLQAVQYRFNAGSWQPAQAVDGQFDGTADSYQFTATNLTSGRYWLEVATLDSAGNRSDSYATATIDIIDPIDGGLNTELYPPPGTITAHEASTLAGVAYHLQGETITHVEYQIDGGGWQPAHSQDGHFDSDHESFTLGIDLSQLEPGFYLIEARASDASGKTEHSFATQEIEVGTAQKYQTFLSSLIRGGA